MLEILPCPFCRGVSFKLDGNRQYGNFAISVRCNKCHARGSVVSGDPNNLEELEVRAIELWNNRPPVNETVEIHEDDIHPPARHQNKGHHRADGKICTYTVYDSYTDEMVAYGTADECAHMMGITRNSFYALVGRALSGKRKKYLVLKEYLDELEEEDYES